MKRGRARSVDKDAQMREALRARSMLLRMFDGDDGTKKLGDDDVL
jgi:hypothetical protein